MRLAKIGFWCGVGLAALFAVITIVHFSKGNLSIQYLKAGMGGLFGGLAVAARARLPQAKVWRLIASFLGAALIFQHIGTVIGTRDLTVGNVGEIALGIVILGLAFWRFKK